MQSERFTPDYSQRVYGAGGLLPRFVSHMRGTGNASPMYVYRWDMMRAALEKFRDCDGDPYEAIMIEYVNPLDGKPVFKTITFFMQMLRPGERTQPLKQTASLLVAPFEGQRLQPDRRQAAGLGAVRHLRRSGRRVGRACQRLRPRAGHPVRRERRADSRRSLALYQKHGRMKNDEVVRLY